MPASAILRRTFSSALLVSLVAASLSSCGSDEVTISLSDPNELRQFASWAEFNVFEGGCPAEEDLALGVYPDPIKSDVVGVDEPIPAIGTLPAKEYGFSVILRQDPDCAIVGFGCVKANLEKVRSVNIKVNPTYLDDEGNLLPEGACVAPESCQQGRCSEEGGEGGSGGAGGSSGAGGGGAGGSGGAPPVLADFECKKTPAGPTSCAMELMGFGAFPAPSSGSKVGSPSVIQSASGFSVAYHELASDGVSRVLRVIPVGLDGCNGALGEASFTECPGKASSFGASLGGAWNPSLNSGLFGFSRVPCQESSRGAGIGLVSVDSTGKLKDFGVIDSGDVNFPSLNFAPQYSISVGLNVEEFRLAYVQNGISQSFPTTGVGTNAAGVDDFFKDVPSGPLTNPAFSVQARSGPLAVQATSGTLQGVNSSVLRIVKGDIKFIQRPEAVELGLQLLSNQILLASRSPANSIEWALLSDDGTQLSPAEANQNNALEATSGGFALASVNDRAVFAVGRQGGLRLSWFSNLSTGAPTANPTKELTQAEIPSLAGFDGKQVAAAAAAGRVVVAWTNSGGASAGGVAVFKCE